MASEIYHMAEDYVTNNAASYDGQSEEQAVVGLVEGCRQHLFAKGWNAEDYSVDLEKIARDGLAKHRSA